MIQAFFRGLVTRAKEVATALKAKFDALFHKLMPGAPAQKFLVPGISTETNNAMKMGKRYRLTSDHSPVFSLYTFFGDR
jgi:predicted phosphoribosyltransferase